MRIVFLQDDFPPLAQGGAGIVAASYAQELIQLGHEVSVITSVQNREHVGRYKEGGITIERIYSVYKPRWRSWKSIYNPVVIRQVKKTLRELSPDIVHIHNVHYHISYWSLRVAKRGGARVFLTAHDAMLFHYGKLSEFVQPDSFACGNKQNYHISWYAQLRAYRFWYNPIRNLCIRHLLTYVDRIFAVSAALKDALEQNGIENVTVLHNGIDPMRTNVDSSEVIKFCNTWGLGSSFIILFGGRLSGLKGAEVALSTIKHLKNLNCNAKLLVLGRRDAYTEKLVQIATEENILDRIVFTGWISGPELVSALHAADVLLVPSLYLDPLPTIVLEAMASSKPVIGGCLGGIPEMVKDGVTGYVINPFDSVEIADRVRSLVENPIMREKFGKKGKEVVLKSFSLRKQTACLIRHYAAAR